jgi:predicted DCC family thiol-disulfide oxidoreductase YuxK
MTESAGVGSDMHETSRGENKNPKAALIYDATCPICKSTVSWIDENMAGKSFEMIPCEPDSVTSRFPGVEYSACMNAMHVVLPDGRVLAGEKALPEIFKRLKRYHAAAILFKLPGASTLSGIAYRWFAARRYRIAAIIAHFMGRKHPDA